MDSSPNFYIQKSNSLKKIDKSSIGKIDEKIKNLCDKINNSPNFFTTSSCSGRIILIKNTPKKEKDIFFFKTHNQTNLNEIKKEIQKIPDKTFYFKMEPSAIHIACKSIEDAKSLLNFARNIGFKKSGIISFKDKYICELFSTEIISTPLTNKASEEYLNLLINEANKKLERTNQKIKELEKFNF